MRNFSRTMFLLSLIVIAVTRARWVDPYFESFDNTISDYNKVYDYTLALLNEAYDEGLIDPSNPIDEVPEIE